jgi:ribosomal protein S12 methylthiotransferase
MDDASPRPPRPSGRSLPVLPATPANPAPSRPVVGEGVVSGGGGVRVAMITLGCDKNTVDSERILGGLLGAGVEIITSPEDADVVVVNTCGFIEIAKQESVDTLLDAARLKEAGRLRAVVGMGCLVQRYKTELEAEMPEVDLFLGLTDAEALVPELTRRGILDPARADAAPLMERPLRVLASGAGPAHTAHLKISEGCDHTCAFCAIPLMRGKFRSTPMDVLVREAQELERRGVVELNIVSQDTTWYGRDWARAQARGDVGDLGDLGVAASGARRSDGYFLGRPFKAMPNLRDAARISGISDISGISGPTVPRTGALPLLLQRLLAETSIPWLRLFYMYPSGITRELVEAIAREDRIMPYLDMPIQHGSDAVLKRMRRPERRSTIVERARWLRDAVPELALRTTVIVGFPGETEDDFEALLDLLDEVGFDHLGAFAYSEEEDTPAATMAGAIPEAVRRERLERLLEHQRLISLERNEARVGRETLVLVDDVDGDLAVARAPWQGPEVDGVVEVEGVEGRGLEAGRFVRVLLTEADDYDVTGRLVE